MKALLTNSRAKSFERCPRLHFYEYERCRRPIVTSIALTFGTLFHAALEAWWHAFKVGAKDPYGVGLHALNAALTDETEVIDEIRAQELFRGYHYRWLADMEHFEVLEVEREFVVPLVDPLTRLPHRVLFQSGKIDALVRDLRDNEPLLVEHKTTTADLAGGSAYWSRLRLDSQVSTYVDAVRQAMGLHVSRCLYDVAQRPTMKLHFATPEPSRRWTKGKGCKPCGGKAGSKGLGCLDCQGTGWKEPPRLDARQRLTDETFDEYRERLRARIADRPNEYFARADIPRLERELDRFRADRFQVGQAIRWHQQEAEVRGEMAWPRSTGACEKFNRRCAFWDVCTGGASLDDDTRFRSTNPHQELSLDPDRNQDA